MQACAQKNGPSSATATAPNNGCLGHDVLFDGPVPVFSSSLTPSSSNNNNNSEQSNNNATYLAPLFFNNLGCINYKLKKFSASSFYLNRALKESEALSSSPSSSSSSSSNNGSINGESDSKRASVDHFARDRKLEMLYNLGLQLLLTGKPELAFQSFQEVAMMYYKAPRVWLRLAESCVASHVLKVYNLFSFSSPLPSFLEKWITYSS